MASHTSGPQVHNKRSGTAPADAVYVGRPSIWGNPFVIGKDGDRNAVVAEFERYLGQTPRQLARLGALEGKHLVCWCAPARCHAHVLLRRANQ